MRLILTKDRNRRKAHAKMFLNNVSGKENLNQLTTSKQLLTSWVHGRSELGYILNLM